MQNKAHMSRRYMWRLGLFALVFLAFGGWSMYDGYVKYPRHNKAVQQAKDYIQAHPNWRDPTSSDHWDPVRHGFAKNTDPSQLKAKSRFDMVANRYVQPAICLPIGLAALFAMLRGINRWVASDEQGLVTSWGQRAAFSSISQLDKTRWRSKGIAVVSYEDQGIQRRLVLDDWKYETQPTTALVDLVESHLKPEQIVGDTSTAGSDAPLP